MSEKNNQSNKGIEEQNRELANKILDDLEKVFDKYKINPFIFRTIRVKNVMCKGKNYPVIENQGELITLEFVVGAKDERKKDKLPPKFVG